uniref:Disease resistance N-terminal domain-containing protein n=1 Tax=Oryza brachyantha TaxID=4533 RepID=J3N9Z2_ORYBR
MDAQSALDSLLGRLTTVLVSEAQLLGGVRGDVEFIRDEMENMDSLVAHIMEGQERDRQVRTWMRHVAGLSRDCEACVELYLHYVAPGGGGGKGLLAQLRWITQLVRTIPARRHVATRIRELKVRARDVGDRRSRYGITVPPALPVPDHQIRSTVDDSPCPASPQPCGPEEEKDDRRRELLFGEMPQAATKLVLQWLQQDNWSLRQEPPPRIIHILGEGAVGEREASTAKMVYDHPHVVSLFQHRFWISFQDNQSSSLFHKMSQLFTDDWKEAARAEGLLPGKKFLLLVLDDLRFNHTEYYGDLLRSILQDFGDRFDFIGATAILLTSRDWDDYTRELSDKTIFISAQGGQIHCPGLFRRTALALISPVRKGPVEQIVERDCAHDAFAMQMFLHLLYTNPYRSTRELESLSDNLREHKNNSSRIMLMFCYNELPIKSLSLHLPPASRHPEDQAHPAVACRRAGDREKISW